MAIDLIGIKETLTLVNNGAEVNDFKELKSEKFNAYRHRIIVQIADALVGYDGITMLGGGSDIRIIYRLGSDLDTLVHEAIHAWYMIMGEIGDESKQTLDYWNSEQNVYNMSEFIVKVIGKYDKMVAKVEAERKPKRSSKARAKADSSDRKVDK